MTFVRLCRRQSLAVMLLALCTVLPLCIGPAAQEALTRGVGFEGISLAVTAPENDGVPQMLEQLLPGMQDVSRYCRVSAMDMQQAQDALTRGEVTAILALPEDFIEGILTGANPDVTLIVSAEHPLQSLLTLWVGQSATDLLSAFQSSIYTVLSAYGAAPPAGLSYNDVVSQINLRCIRWTLDRQDLFTQQRIPVTGALPIGLHYSLSILLFLVLACAAVFTPVYDPSQIGAMERCLCAGRSAGGIYAAVFCGCWLFCLCLVLPGALLLTKGKFLSVLACSLVVSFFCAGFGSLCCLITRQASQGGLLASLLSLGMLGVSGGILPPVMLPGVLRKISRCSPVTWMRQLLAWGGGYDRPGSAAMAALALAAALLAVLGGIIYCRRFRKAVMGL